MRVKEREKSKPKREVGGIKYQTDGVCLSVCVLKQEREEEEEEEE